MTMPAPAWKQVPVLQGRHVRLQPLTLDHVPALRTLVAGGEFASLWFTNVPDAAGVQHYVERALQDLDQGKALPFVVLDGHGHVVGSTRYYDLVPEVPGLNIGYTWYAPRVQRTAVNTEAKRLLLQHAFQVMGCIRVGFETSHHNLRSRTAIARLGAVQEGILRNHKRHTDGSVRDTVVFSIIDREWPQVQHRLQARLDQDP